MSFTLPDLPYAYDALEPYIDARTMEIHHDKHHAGYVAKLNAAIEKAPDLAGRGLEDLLRSIDSLPESVRTAVRNSGGGHFNHTLFWQILGAGGEPAGEIKNALQRDFGSFEQFKTEFGAAAAGRFGSGWAWLSKKSDGGLVVHSTANQDTPLAEGLVPILGLDVWEHAYYLKYQNRRADYIEAFWSIINWKAVEKNYTS